MPITPEKYIRKPLVVVGVEVTEDNFMELALWVQGSIMNIDGSEADGPIDSKNQFILVRVHNPKSPRQSRAFVGDWILYSDRGYKVYTPKAFKNTFDPAEAKPSPSRVDLKRAEADRKAKATRKEMLEQEGQDEGALARFDRQKQEEKVNPADALHNELDDEPILTHEAQQEAEVEQAKVEEQNKDDYPAYLDEREKDEELFLKPLAEGEEPESQKDRLERLERLGEQRKGGYDKFLDEKENDEEHGE